MRKIFLGLLAGLQSLTPLAAQEINCREAGSMLQTYANQVNQIYYQEYTQVIPTMRCPAYDTWGQWYNPVMVQNCRVQMYNYLNSWYAQQYQVVSNWYATISRTCASRNSPPTIGDKPVVDQRENRPINTDAVDELIAGVDDSRTVKIIIPGTPEGFKP